MVEHLSDIVGIEWAEVVELADKNLDKLAEYVEAYATIQRTTIALRIEGRALKSKTGHLRANPLYKVQAKAMHKLATLASQLGLTSLARAQRRKGLRLQRDRTIHFCTSSSSAIASKRGT